MKKEIYKYEKGGAEFLSPTQVNSAIRWTMEAEIKQVIDEKGVKPPHTTLSANAAVHLTDCNRWISWEGYGYSGKNDFDDMVTKVSVAIDQLTQFRMHLLHMQRGIKKYHKAAADDEE